MNKKLGFVAALGAMVAMSSCSKKLGDFAADYFTTNPNPLEVVGEKVPGVVTGNIPAKFFQKNAQVTVTPYLVYNNTETASHAYTFQGENVRGNNPVISYDNGGTVTIPVGFDYVPEMAQSKLELGFTVTQGNNQYVLPRVTVADGVVGTAYMADAATIMPCLAEDKFQRIINEKYDAEIMFLINVANIREDQLTTQQMVDLWNQIDATHDNPNYQLQDINIKSYASPDGGYEFNYNLAEEREKNTQKYVDEQLKKAEISGVEQTSEFTAEDWEGFRKLVEASNLQDKNLILSVLSRFEDPEEREAQLRNLAEVFPVIADQILPRLRYSRITASIDAIGKTDEEIMELVSSNPNSLSVDELLYAATTTDDNSKKEQIYALAAQLYPNDYRTWNNLGYTQYIDGDFSNAASAFNKAKSLASSNNSIVAMNQGLIELNNGNYQAANKLFGSAAGADGLGQALGTYYMKLGDNVSAAKAFGDAISNNAALSQILNQNYSKAGQILNAISTPDATTYYLKAILGARTNNENMVSTNLNKAIQLDSSMAQKAIGDLEFINYNIANIIK